MRLDDLLDGLEIIETREYGDREIRSISTDSRTAGEGSLFIALSGHNADGHDHMHQAVERGASALVVERPGAEKIPTIVVADTGRAESALARKYYGAPDSRLILTGITGTNGKTSSAFMLQSIYGSAFGDAGIIGTVGYGLPGRLKKVSNTTPAATGLFSMMSEFVEEGCKAAVMEVSSHAAVQGRISGIEFDVGVFTNITRDHLDYHGTFREYVAAKELFATTLLSGDRDKTPGILVYNLEDDNVAGIASRFAGEKISFGTGRGAMVRAERIKADLEGTSFTLVTPDGDVDIDMQLLGRFSVLNALAAAGSAVCSSIGLGDIKKGLEDVAAVPGRFQVIREAGKPVVVIDYAHTPDALESLLRFCRELEPDRLISVFGCGGDRDRGKRPIMGAIAARESDIVYVTSDNPRKENPDLIISEIIEGIKSPIAAVRSSVDRSMAIKSAIGEADPGDLVVIAGKGHEDYQVIGNDTIKFSDHIEALKALNDPEVDYQD